MWSSVKICNINSIALRFIVMDISKTLDLIEKNVTALKRRFDQLDKEVENLKIQIKKIRTAKFITNEIQLEENIEKLQIFTADTHSQVIMNPSDFRDLILYKNRFFYIFIKNQEMKSEILGKFCKILGMSIQTSVFCFTKNEATGIAERMDDKGFTVSALVGGKPETNTEIMNKVKAGTCKMLTLTAGVVNNITGLTDLIQKSVIINLYQKQDLFSVKKLFGLDKSFNWRGFAVFTVEENSWEESFRFLKEFKGSQAHEIFRLLYASEESYCVVDL